VWLNRSQTHDHKEVGPQIIKLLGRSKLECFILKKYFHPCLTSFRQKKLYALGFMLYDKALWCSTL
jgi:hypothetical protein